MSFFSEASLAMIPSGYKTSKVYSAIPTSGDGDLTFSRSNDTATRVGPDGLIEKVRTNIVLYSEQFDNAYWTKSQATITANATTAPDGTLTAEKFIEGSGSVAPECSRTPIATSNSIFTLSVFAKASERNFLIINNNDGTGSFRVWFNLTTGVIGTTDAGVTAFIENVGNGWFRCGAARQITAFASATSGFQIGSADGVQTYTGDGTSGIFIWGAQMELSDFGPTDYIATTAAAVSVGPVANVPRLDYLDSSSPRLLLEPQRTNVLTFSEQLNNAAWALDGNGVGQSVTANYAVSPDGYTNADRVQLNRTGGTYSRLRQDYVAVGNHTGAVYLKSNTGASQKIWMRVDGTITTKITITTSWQRFVVSGSTSAAIELFIDNTDAEIATIADFSAWGAQLEAGVYATSHIPTLGAAVTRGADLASKTSIGSLIGQQEGVVFVDFVYNGSAAEAGNLFNMNTSTTASVFIARTSAGLTDCGVFVSSLVKGQIVGVGSITIGTRIKLAYAYKSGSSALYINGTQIGTSSDTFTIPSALTEIHLNDDTAFFAFQQNVSFNQHLLFPTRLSNSDLAALTA
jgi:hypothetical protein